MLFLYSLIISTHFNCQNDNNWSKFEKKTFEGELLQTFGMKGQALTFVSIESMRHHARKYV